MKKTLRNQQGFSLIETVIALVILAVGLIGLLGLQGASLRMNQKNKIAKVGTDVLVAQIERIMPLSNLVLSNDRTDRKALVNTVVGKFKAYSELSTEYKYDDTNSSQKIDTGLPTGYDYMRWRGVTKTLTEGEDGNAGQTVSYVVKTAIDKKYLKQDVLARGLVTVYWPNAKRGVDFLETSFFVERK